MSSSERAGGGSGAGPVAPLYARLPHGPHRLDHEEVVHHQRARIHGALVEAVAANGYAGTSVREVVGLAGVSRRSFYEQFANKQECFLATYDLIAARGVERIRRANRSNEGDLEERLRVGLEGLAVGIAANWNAARLVIVDAQTAGPAGLERLRDTTSACERMLYDGLAREPAPRPLEMPIVRGIVGGLHWVLSACMRMGDAQQLPALTEEMRRWVLLFRSNAAGALADRALEPAPRGEANRHDAAERSVSASDDRGRLLHEAMRLALRDDYKDLSVLQIAEAADVSLDVFFETFNDKDACFLAALDMLAGELVQIAGNPDLLRPEDWPRAVRRTMAELMGYLAERPLYAQTIAAGAFAAGRQAAERDRELVRSITTLLVAGAPQEPQSAIAVDGIAGAIGHTIRCQVQSDEIGLLGAVSDHLAYVVLAPYIGADAAAAIVTEEEPLAERI